MIVVAMIELTCKGCCGTGTFDTLCMGTRKFEACQGQGVVSFRIRGVACFECGGDGIKLRIFQGEQEVGGDIECFPVAGHFPCQRCRGAAWLPLSPWTLFLKFVLAKA